MKNKSKVLWIDPELVAKKMKAKGFDNRFSEDGNDHDQWCFTLMDVLEDMYCLETEVHDLLERIK